MDSSYKNSYEKYIPLFEKWPHVTAASVQGESGLRVSGWHDTPEGAKWATDWGFRAMFAWGASLGYCLIAAHPHLQHNEYFGMKTCTVLVFILWVVLSILTGIVFSLRAEKAKIILLSPSFIQIGEKVYDARVQHKFTMDLHRKAKEEADADLREQQRGPGYADTRHKRYYRDSYHIFLEYLGQRILVADVFKEETAEAFLRALVAVDKIVHKEKTVFVAGAQEANENKAAQRQDYFGIRPTLD